MYYPFLRSRQFELIALRELVNEEITQKFVIPILEPVKETRNNLNLAYKVFQEKGQSAFLIVNPLVGDSSGDNHGYLEYLRELNDDVFKPAFYYRNNSNYISTSIRDYNLSDCMLICQNDLVADNADFRNLVEQDYISSINNGETRRDIMLKEIPKVIYDMEGSTSREGKY